MINLSGGRDSPTFKRILANADFVKQNRLKTDLRFSFAYAKFEFILCYGKDSLMKILFAPLEGITFAVYRAVHAHFFPGVAAYYTPFIAPDTTGSFKPRFLRELTYDRESGLNIIPQILAGRAEPFNTTAIKLHALGFSEIDLNTGCPSSTVFSKHKGAGMLADLPALDAFLYSAFSSAEKYGYRIGIKTRMGVHSTQEFPELLEIYNQYPLSHLIVHARARDGYYFACPDLSLFAEYSRSSRCPITYNGNIFSEDDLHSLLTLCPEIGQIMVGRGAVANPALIRILSGGKALQCEELQQFHDTLVESYLNGGLSPAFTAERMKQIWYYMHCMFRDCKREYKALLKTKNLSDYRVSAGILFSSGKFDADSCFYSPSNI